MKKLDYIHECLKRNPNLKGDVLQFHKDFPPAFFRVLRLVGPDGMVVRGSGDRELPKWLAPILERVPNEVSLYIGRPQKLEDLREFNKMSIQMEGFKQMYPGRLKETYWGAIKKTPAEWLKAWNTLRQKWSMVDISTLQSGNFDPQRPPILASSSPFNLEKWKEDLSNLAHGVKMVVPIYEDTSQDDIDWKQIALFQAYLYGTKRRATPGKYELKLKVWDTYREENNFAKVSKALGMPRTTVKSLYDSVRKDILGPIPPGTIEEKRALAIDIQSHIAGCSRCQNAKEVKQMCPQIANSVEQDTKAMREITVGLYPEVYKKFTSKLSTSDEQF